MMETIVHYGLHFIAPAGIAWLIDKKRWKKLYVVLLLTMLVDADHLLADPIFKANRCSVGFHPLHSYPAILAYIVGLVVFWRKVIVRTVFIGLLFHMFTDFVDCIWMWEACGSCFDEYKLAHPGFAKVIDFLKKVIGLKS
ncbi:hypothetical protein FUAX_00920 [Fulvitalea axinellae]|uniref:Metal-dependent hydrolase n=1 Tax=Fulvitalea axinellae TaxID=1182444 RepID=A0AAU9D9W5_9BACT|nr:hypothetical protein FUAX_00920 [Fulvitalea axinellae]